jgi:hypothetical protein
MAGNAKVLIPRTTDRLARAPRALISSLLASFDCRDDATLDGRPFLQGDATKTTLGGCAAPPSAGLRSVVKGGYGPLGVRSSAP